MANNYSSVGEVAARLKVAYWRIKYAHAAGYIKEPLRVGNHRLYSEDDIHELELYFDQKKGGNGQVQLPGQRLPRLAKSEGLCLCRSADQRA